MWGGEGREGGRERDTSRGSQKLSTTTVPLSTDIFIGAEIFGFSA